MISDHPQRELLLAYVDHRLDEARAQEAELLIENDPDAAEFVALLEQSSLPFAGAFEQMLALPLPDHIVQMVEHDEADSSAGFIRGKPFWGGIAAGLGVGLLSTLLVMQWLRPIEPPAFVENVSQYQSLYQRDTVASADAPDYSNLERMMTENLGKKIKIPDLGEHDFQFKRGQLLQFEGKPLIQLVYLADHGVPVALCITPSSQANTLSAEFGKSHGLNYGYWREDGLEFVLVGDESHSLDTLVSEAIAQI